MKSIISAFAKGIVMGVAVSLIVSIINNDGTYYPMSPTSAMGEWYFIHLNEWQRMLVSVIIWGCIGLLFYITSKIYTRTDWSISRMTAIHFLATLLGFTPLAILAGWFPFKVEAVVSFFIIFTIIYVALWFITSKLTQKEVEAINAKLDRR